MTKAALGGGLFLAPGHENEVNILNQFKLVNPEYKMAMGLRNQGKYIALPDQHINACHRIPHEHPWGGGLASPRKAATSMGIASFVDARTAPSDDKIHLNDEFSLRAYQQEALDSWLKTTERV